MSNENPDFVVGADGKGGSMRCEQYVSYTAGMAYFWKLKIGSQYTTHERVAPPYTLRPCLLMRSW